MGLVLNTNGNNGNGGNGNVDLGDFILKIDNLAVNKRNNVPGINPTIVAGDEIRGELPVGSNRHIVALVTGLPYDAANDANLKIYSENFKEP